MSALSVQPCSPAHNGDAPGSDVIRTIKSLEEQLIVHYVRPAVSARNRSREPLGLLQTLTQGKSICQLNCL
jgi:hypothetical protein